MPRRINLPPAVLTRPQRFLPPSTTYSSPCGRISSTGATWGSNLFQEFAIPRRRPPIHLEILLCPISRAPFFLDNYAAQSILFTFGRCHSGELVYTFGTLGQSSLPFRDEFDQPFEQAILDMWVAFARTYNPNPSPAFLEARGYTSTSAALKRWGPWKDVKSDAPVRILDWPSRGSDWLERRQCEIPARLLREWVRARPCCFCISRRSRPTWA
jgi:hypothetical protein